MRDPWPCVRKCCGADTGAGLDYGATHLCGTRRGRGQSPESSGMRRAELVRAVGPAAQRESRGRLDEDVAREWRRWRSRWATSERSTGTDRRPALQHEVGTGTPHAAATLAGRRGSPKSSSQSAGEHGGRVRCGAQEEGIQPVDSKLKTRSRSKRSPSSKSGLYFAHPHMLEAPGACTSPHVGSGAVGMIVRSRLIGADFPAG